MMITDEGKKVRDGGTECRSLVFKLATLIRIVGVWIGAVKVARCP